MNAFKHFLKLNHNHNTTLGNTSDNLLTKVMLQLHVK